jgi:hypothetical protein
MSEFYQRVFIQKHLQPVMNFNRAKVVKFKSEKSKNASLQVVIGPCLVYGQIFGMIPAVGIMSGDVDKISFRWRSFRAIYSMFFLFCCTSDSVLGIARLVRRGFSIYHFEALIFFILATIRGLIFFRLATKWKKIMRRWKKCEEPFVSAPYGVRGWSLSRRIRIVFVVLAFLGAGKIQADSEGLWLLSSDWWFQLNTIYGLQIQYTKTTCKSPTAIQCQRFSGTTSWLELSHIFDTSLATALFFFLYMKWVGGVPTDTSSFYLSAVFIQQLPHIFSLVVKLPASIHLELWRHFRRHDGHGNQLPIQSIQRLFLSRSTKREFDDESNVARLESSLFPADWLGLLHRPSCFAVDSLLAGPQHAGPHREVLQCLQVSCPIINWQKPKVNTTFPRPNRITALSHGYFWFYIVFLTFRTMAVLFAAAGLNEACKKPLNYIREVPSRFWSLDVS